ncbi:hypothetical protein FIU94_01070 [Sulfitobacter sp. THAF37]|nr:hypothetical protein FIU94_01070 [Sulfitobacter sp. THAF37]
MKNSPSELAQADARAKLVEAAKLVEDAAYDLATSHSSRLVSELIVIAADLDRISSGIVRNEVNQDASAKG